MDDTTAGVMGAILKPILADDADLRLPQGNLAIIRHDACHKLEGDKCIIFNDKVALSGKKPKNLNYESNI